MADESRDGGLLPNQGQLIGGKGPDGAFYYILVGTDGTVQTSGGGGGGGGGTAAGAANLANGQVALSTTAGTIKAANATRRSITITNLDGAITVYVGIATVTAANGMPLQPGQSISIDSVVLIQGLAASGTPNVAYMESYD